jgi:hypothetical protein
VIRRVSIEGQCALDGITDYMIVFDNQNAHAASIHARRARVVLRTRQVHVSLCLKNRRAKRGG